MSELHPNFKKVYCPLRRVEYKINRDDWKKHGSRLMLREPKVYLATPEINPDVYVSWVWDEDAYAVEKLHGTNLCIEMKEGCLETMQNRLNPMNFTKLVGNKQGIAKAGRFLEGVIHAAERNYLHRDGVEYGELIGPSMNQNIHKTDRHLWYPFKRAQKQLRYNSFGKFPKEYWGWSEWFRLHLKSILYCRLNGVHLRDAFSDDNVPFTEGIVIYKDREEGEKPLMAKLRRDMFFWYYCEDIEIFGLGEEFISHAKEKGIKVKGYTD